MTPSRLLSLALALAALAPASALAQDAGNAARGKVLFLQCAACHAVTAEAPPKVGPNLVGIAGAPAAARPGYAYSPAFQAAKITWTDERLSAFIEKPGHVVPGNKMVFGGVADAARRADIVAYLKTAK